MSTNAAAPAQAAPGMEVTDEDINPPAPTEGTTPEPKGEPKTEQTQTQSQPNPPEGEAKEKGPGPWDAELAKRGLNTPEFDSFLRDVVQPYVTQLEQGGGGNDVFEGDIEGATAMKSLLEDLRNDPVQTYRDLGEALGITDDPGMGVEGEGLDEGDEMLPEGGPEATEVEDNDPWREEREYVQQLRQREQEQLEDQQLEEMLGEMDQRIPGFDSDLFVHMLISSGGDRNVALTNYMKWHQQPAPQEQAPPTLEGGGTPPPEATKHTSIDSALEDFLAEDRASRSR